MMLTGSRWFNRTQVLALFALCLCVSAIAQEHEEPDARFVVDGRVHFDVTDDDMATIQRLMSGVGMGSKSIEDWESERLKELGVQYIQIPNAFNAGVTRVDGKLVYDFSVARKLAQEVIDAGFEPKFIIASATPTEMSSRPLSDQSHHYPPANWDEYEDFIYQTIRYFNVTLARLGFKVTYWDVHNEPDGSGYWFPEEPMGSEVKYEALFELYRHTVNAVEKYERDFPGAPKVKIGGCRFTSATFVYGDFNWVERFLRDCQNTGTRLDFISFHFYGNGGSYAGTANWSDAPSLAAKIHSYQRWIKAYSPDTELHLTEWGASEVNHTGSEGIVNGNHVGAAFAAAFLKSIAAQGVDRAFFLSTKDRINLPSSGLEKNVWEMEALYTHDGYTKAITNALWMYRMMAPQRVEVTGKALDVDMIASRDQEKITLMVWNHNVFGPDSRKAGPRDVAIRVLGLDGWDRAKIRRFLIDETHSNAHHYKNDMTQMAAHQNLEEISTQEAATQTVWSGTFLDLPIQKLNPESVMFIEITRGDL